MSEPFVRRPNSFTVDGWNLLTRAQQIDWWQRLAVDQKDGLPHPLRLDPLFRDGEITENELCHHVFIRLTADNVRVFVNECSTAVLEILRKQSNEMPADDDFEGWQQVIFIHTGVWDRSVMSQEDIQRQYDEIDRRWIEGLKIFRAADQR